VGIFGIVKDLVSLVPTTTSVQFVSLLHLNLLMVQLAARVMLIVALVAFVEMLMVCVSALLCIFVTAAPNEEPLEVKLTLVSKVTPGTARVAVKLKVSFVPFAEVTSTLKGTAVPGVVN